MEIITVPAEPETPPDPELAAKEKSDPPPEPISSLAAEVVPPEENKFDRYEWTKIHDTFALNTAVLAGG